MKRKFTSHPVAKTLFVAFTLAAPSAHATILYWDPTATAGTGGTGATTSETTEWKTSGTTAWWNGSGDVTWTDGNDATFANAVSATTIKLGSNVSVGMLNLGSNYTIDLRDLTTATNYSLTLTGFTGGSGSLSKITSSTGNGSLVMNMAADTDLTGKGAFTQTNLSLTIQGGKTLTVDGAGRNGGSGQLTTTVTGTGTRLNILGTASNNAGNNLTVTAGGALDIGQSTYFDTRGMTLDNGGTITTSNGGTLGLSNQFGGVSMQGNLTGNLKLELKGSVGAYTTTIAGASNSFSGGLTLSASNVSGTHEVIANADNALGTGQISFNNASATANTSIHTARVTFRSPTPSVGAIATSTSGFTKGAKSIVLGNTGFTESTAFRGTLTNLSNVITLTSGNTNSIAVGQTITCSFGGINGATVTGITDGTHFTISQNANAGGTLKNIGATALSTNLSIGSLNTDTTFAGVISEVQTGSGITKTGTGKFTLAGAASYTGATTVANGTLVVGSGAAVTGTAVTGALNNNSLTYTTLPAGVGVGQTVTGTNIPANTKVIGVDTTGKIVYLSSLVSAAGSTTPSYGAWQSLPAATNVVLGSSSTNGTLDLNNSTQRIVGLSVAAGATAASQKVGNGGTVGDATLETTGTSVFGGVISDTLTTGNKKTNLSVISGSLTLTGTNTYTGATTVSAGTLLVNGSLGNSATTVNGGTLGGSGTIGGAVTIDSGAFLAPGASIESLGVASADINGSLVVEYDGTGVGSIDLLAVTSLLDLTGATVDFNLLGTALDDPYYIFATYGSLTGNFGTVTDLPGGYEIQYAYNNGVTSTNIALVAVPEPNIFHLIGGLGIVTLLRRRRS